MTDEEPLLTLDRAPVALTLPVRYVQRLMTVLAEANDHGDREPGDKYLMSHLRECSEASLRAHREAGVQPPSPGRVIPLPVKPAEEPDEHHRQHRN